MKKPFETAVVTGASSGIGREIAIRLLDEGAVVALLARRQAALEELQGTTGRRGVAIRADVTSPESIGGAALTVERALPQGIDLLVVAAGLGIFGRVGEIPPAGYRRMFDTNVLGAIETIRAFLPAVRRRRGTILAITSLAGRIAAPGMSGYCATKFALHGFLDGLRLEEHRAGVAVVEVCPGAVDTPFFTAEAPKDRMPNGAKLVRMLGPAEVAKVALSAARRRKPRTTLPLEASLLAWFSDAFPFVSRPVQRLIER